MFSSADDVLSFRNEDREKYREQSKCEIFLKQATVVNHLTLMNPVFPQRMFPILNQCLRKVLQAQKTFSSPQEHFCLPECDLSSINTFEKGDYSNNGSSSESQKNPRMKTFG